MPLRQILNPESRLGFPSQPIDVESARKTRPNSEALIRNNVEVKSSDLRKNPETQIPMTTIHRWLRYCFLFIDWDLIFKRIQVGPYNLWIGEIGMTQGVSFSQSFN